MKKFKKIAAVAMTVCVALTASVTAVSASHNSNDPSISNEYIQVFANSARFCAFTTGGNPNTAEDDNQKLLFDMTSRTYCSIDNRVSYTDGDITVSDDQKSLIQNSTYDGIDFTRSITLINNSTTGREDALEVKFVAVNNSSEAHNVGARIMLDTMLATNDDAPFRVPGIGPVTTRLELRGSQIPNVYQVFDDLANPKVVAAGSFAKGSGAPNTVQFNNFYTSNVNFLYPDVNTEEAIGDSTVNAIWDEKSLNPGESRVFTAYYGLGEVIVNNDSKLAIGATKVEQAFELNEDGTGYNPVSLMGYIKNAGLDNLTNATISISLPNDITLESGESSIAYDSLAVGAEQQTTWILNAQPRNEARTVTITVNGTSSETGDVQPVQIQYTIPAVEGAEILPTNPTEEPTEKPTEAPTEAPTDSTDATDSPTQPTNSTSTAPSTEATKVITTPTTNTTVTTTTSGKTVSTGDNTVLFLIIMAGAAASVTALISYKRKSNKA